MGETTKSTLRRAREDAGYSHEEVARKLGVSVRMVYRYEAGEAVVADPRKVEMARLYDRPILDLFFSGDLEARRKVEAFRARLGKRIEENRGALDRLKGETS